VYGRSAADPGMVQLMVQIKGELAPGADQRAPPITGAAA
jgi:hypothetical protein